MLRNISRLLQKHEIYFVGYPEIRGKFSGSTLNFFVGFLLSKGLISYENPSLFDATKLVWTANWIIHTSEFP